MTDIEENITFIGNSFLSDITIENEDTITIEQELSRRKKKLLSPHIKTNFLKSPFVNTMKHSDKSTFEEEWF